MGCLLLRYFQPVFVHNWEVQVQFKVHSNENKKKDLFGDGMAIWYVKEHSQLGPVFGNKDYFTGLAVMLDTYSNHNGPHNVIVAVLKCFIESINFCVLFIA